VSTSRGKGLLRSYDFFRPDDKKAPAGAGPISVYTLGDEERKLYGIKPSEETRQAADIRGANKP